MITIHEFARCEVQCTRMGQAAGAAAFYCQVIQGGRVAFSVTIPEADSPEEAARIAADMAL